MSCASRVARLLQSMTMSRLWYASSHSTRSGSPVPRYGVRSSGATIASALKSTAGAATPTSARRAQITSCTSGWFSQLVPRRFQMNGTASSRKTSTPRLARRRIVSSIAQKTSGFDQSRSHCQLLNVVQTQASSVGSHVKLPGANAGKTSRSVRS